ncbi:MAG: bifunctional (p)ppGpp synthetase/guanosine-3',5'-bis(diphosphate) 3'-pyrophosphohydrolase [Candidatus Marinimicrobia bacterium]|nr:bifunctional (p)ppGpp synthetase/guanosine-3',5'-bis(diphosphate) 3'-pyrophosphohydrolase [Candidatus Neomarinimicrobiota bacterium]MCF7829693.1 bifunctional (p)ppGpp synthetase/guanosine-3',5'-bis(diphosphate) 3'-pyrophosphohydrolase [Candidatus Neomarinimicrobiota bacterium]MCF7881643.1 bifunctional (p)ppGpp synthetase/guanosine-3',5'-bis(diphosphate) 3'-pyrophosphohydrolase [Candidatus Neomarinimicrobiota bacterium]
MVESYHGNGQYTADKLWEAYQFGKESHEGQLRKSGDPYFDHCVEVAKILADLHMDITTIMASLLHDVVEDTGVSVEDVREKFDDDVATLVDGVTKLGDIKFKSRQEKQAGNFRKMLLSVAEDIRVIIIKFADRLHNMRTLEYLPPIKQRRIAIETRDVYAPLAHRLGIAKVKWEMEDLVLKTLDRDAYYKIQKGIAEKRKEREKYIERFAEPIREQLKQYSINTKIIGRPKHFYSIYGKMKRRNKPLDEIYDLLAIRIVVDRVEECYTVLGIIHQLFTPVQDRFKDFIATPKINGYQSIHTTVIGPDGKMVEIQIRTHEMNKTAEEGVAAHWRYKEGEDDSDEEVDKQVKWLRDLVDILQNDSDSPKEFMNTLKIDLFKDEIFIFTPKGDLIQLPKGSTPVDFAFEVHTEVGLHCIGAKLNGKIVPLNSEIKSGDTVEIITSDTQSPSYSWLKFVKTTKAISAIKRWIRRNQFEESVKLGKEILEKEIQRLDTEVTFKDVRDSHEKFGYDKEDKLFAAVGNGEATVKDLVQELTPEQEVKEAEETDGKEKFFSLARKKAKGVKVQGISNMMIKFSNCCSPIPGDPIIGFVTRGRGVSIHRSDCKNIPALLKDEDRKIEVDWDVAKDQDFMVRLKLLAEEQKGFLRNVTEALSEFETNIISVDLKVEGALITCIMVVEVEHLRQLNRVMNKLRSVENLISVERD